MLGILKSDTNCVCNKTYCIQYTYVTYNNEALFWKGTHTFPRSKLQLIELGRGCLQTLSKNTTTWSNEVDRTHQHMKNKNQKSASIYWWQLIMDSRGLMDTCMYRYLMYEM